MVVGVDSIRYAAANARVRGLHSRLLDQAAWQALVMADGLDAAIALLRTSDYGEVIAEAEQGGNTSLERIERHLWAKAASNWQKAMAFGSGDIRALLLTWWQRLSLENLKAILRGFDQKMPPERIRSYLIPLDEQHTLPWDALLREHSLSSLVERLADTRYGGVLRAALPLYERDRSLFVIEIALDIRYYRDLAAAIMRLRGSEGEQARRLLGTWLDALNIQWAFRHRIYYHLSPEEIINYTLWNTIRTDTDLVRDIALGASPDEILIRVWGEGAIDPSFLEGVEDEAQMVLRLELALTRYWQSLARRAVRGYPFGLGAILGYVVLVELEVRDLVTILEGKGMGWDHQRISQRLIGWEE